MTFASLESATISLRSKATTRAAAERGGPLPGRSPYGYPAGMAALVEHEAHIVREAATRLIGGEWFVDVCSDWIDRGGQKTMPRSTVSPADIYSRILRSAGGSWAIASIAARS